MNDLKEIVRLKCRHPGETHVSLPLVEQMQKLITARFGFEGISVSIHSPSIAGAENG